jgi:hypothetical protein
MKDGGDLGPYNKAMSTGDAHAHCSKHYQNFQSREKNPRGYTVLNCY